MKEYKKNIENFIKDIKYIIPLIITAVLGFGFVLTHSSVNIDTLSSWRYFEGQELLAQNRFGAPLFNKIFNVMSYNPFFVDFLAVLFLMFAAILFCSLFKKVSNNKLKPIVYTIFSCFFISYPLMPEIFTYTPASLSICLCYTLVAFALILSDEYIENKKRILILPLALILCFIISIYESFAAVYLLGIFMIFIIKLIYTDNKYKFYKVILDIIKLLIPLIIGLLLEILIAKLLRYSLNIPLSGCANKIITYETLGFIGGIKNLFQSIVIKFIASGACYIPITTFAISSLLSLIIGVITSFKKKNFMIFILFIGLIISAISLSIVQGMASPYRTCQTFALFVGFIFMLLSQGILTSKLKTFIKQFLLVLVFIIIFYQVKDLHKWFYVNYMRYEEEKNASLLICSEISKKYGNELPIIIIGQMKLSNNINKYLYLSSDEWHAKYYSFVISLFDIPYPKSYNIKIPETNVNSYLTWGGYIAFGEASGEDVKFFNLLGYDFKNGTCEMYNNSIEISKTLPQWPKEGSIVKMDNYILVNL